MSPDESKALRKKEKDREKYRRWVSNNREAYLAAQRRNRAKNGHKWREKNRVRCKLWRLENLSAVKEKELEYRKAHRQEARDRERSRRLANPERKRALNAEYRRNNSDKLRKKAREYRRERSRRDPMFRIIGAIRATVSYAVRSGRKPTSITKSIGCTPIELRAYLEARFQPGMTWENHGRSSTKVRRWQVDHIIPLSHFDLTCPKSFAKACHYTNLQPLWAIDNIRKGNRIITVISGGQIHDPRSDGVEPIFIRRNNL